MFILIFINPKQINVTYSYGCIWVLILTSKILRRLWKKKTYIINHIPIKQVWLEENIILIKDVKIWVNKKLLKNPIEKKGFL
jgi:hypothetical protein